MQYLIVPIVKKIPCNKIGVKICREHRGYWEFGANYGQSSVRTDICQAVVNDKHEAINWFKSRIALFLETSEESLSPLWIYALPRSLWPC